MNVSLEGQKTGFYIDQRENRAYIRKIAGGCRVLDLCCYTGGFAINAAVGGASSVTGVDSSTAAIELANRNAEENRVSGICNFMKHDIVNFMKAAAANGDQWDIVILDPPKLAPTKADLRKSESRYRKLNKAAAGLVAPGGLLMTCSCSGAMTLSGRFPNLVKESITFLGRRPVLVRKSSAGGDHVINPSHPESEYLVNLAVVVV